MWYVSADCMITDMDAIAKLMWIQAPNEPRYEDVLACSNGIYIGRTLHNTMPFFLDHTKLINPHIFIVGITGSGKSYLMKTLLYRLSTLSQARILVLDFTGEYKEVASLLGYSSSLDIDRLPRESVYVGLATLGNEEQKKGKAERILNEFIERMRNRAYSDCEVFVFLDEAWKLVSYDSIELLIREGRKYRVGLILASQMIGDIKDNLFENIATFFVFRLQNGDALEKLTRNYGINAEQVKSIQELGVGSCMVLQMHKAKEHSSFFIKRVEGIEIEKLLVLYLGDEMEVSINEEEFEKMLSELGIGSDQAGIGGIIENGRRIRLDRLIARLIGAGVERRSILAQLRKAHVPEKEIAEAFAIALTRGNQDA